MPGQAPITSDTSARLTSSFTMLIAFAALVIGGIIFVYERNQATASQSGLTDHSDSLRTQLADGSPATGTALFSSSSLKLSFRHPADWTRLDISAYSSYPGATFVALASPDTQSQLKAGIPGVAPDLRAYYFASAKLLPDNQGKASGATSLVTYLENQKATPFGAITDFTLEKIPNVYGTHWNLYFVQTPNVGGIGNYYMEYAGKVWVFQYDTATVSHADMLAIFSSLKV